MAFVRKENPQDETIGGAPNNTLIVKPSTAPGAVSGPSALTASSNVSAASQPVQQSSGFTNLNEYLRANDTGATNLGNRVSGDINTKVGTATDGINTAKDSFGNKIAAGTVNYNAGLMNNVANDASSYLTNSDVLKQLSGQYGGPSNFSGSTEEQDATKKVLAAREAGELAGTVEGRTTILNNVLNTAGSRPTTMGGQNLNQFLVQNTAPAYNAVKGAADAASPIAQNYATEQQALQQRIADAAVTSSATKAQALSRLQTGRTDMQAAINAEKLRLQNQAGLTAAQRDAAIRTYLASLGAQGTSAPSPAPAAPAPAPASGGAVFGPSPNFVIGPGPATPQANYTGNYYNGYIHGQSIFNNGVFQGYYIDPKYTGGVNTNPDPATFTNSSPAWGGVQTLSPNYNPSTGVDFGPSPNFVVGPTPAPAPQAAWGGSPTVPASTGTGFYAGYKHGDPIYSNGIFQGNYIDPSYTGGVNQNPDPSQFTTTSPAWGGVQTLGQVGFGPFPPAPPAPAPAPATNPPANAPSATPGYTNAELLAAMGLTQGQFNDLVALQSQAKGYGKPGVNMSNYYTPGSVGTIGTKDAANDLQEEDYAALLTLLGQTDNYLQTGTAGTNGSLQSGSINSTLNSQIQQGIAEKAARDQAAAYAAQLAAQQLAAQQAAAAQLAQQQAYQQQLAAQQAAFQQQLADQLAAWQNANRPAPAPAPAPTPAPSPAPAPAGGGGGTVQVPVPIPGGGIIYVDVPTGGGGPGNSGGGIGGGTVGNGVTAGQVGLGLNAIGAVTGVPGLSTIGNVTGLSQSIADSLTANVASQNVASVADAMGLANTPDNAAAISAAIDSAPTTGDSNSTSAATTGPDGTGGAAAAAAAAAASAASANGASPAAAAAAGQAAADAAVDGASPAAAAAAGAAAAAAADGTAGTSADGSASSSSSSSSSSGVGGPAGSSGEGSPSSGPGDGGGGGGGGKIICTAMNDLYGLPYNENKVWIKYAVTHMKPEHQAGYHKVFLPLVDFAFKKGDGKLNLLVRKSLIWIGRERTKDLQDELAGRNPRWIKRALIRKPIEKILFLIGKWSKK